MKIPHPHYLKLLCASASTLLMIDAASAGSDDPEKAPIDPEVNYEDYVDAQFANFNLLEVSTDDDIFFTPAFVDAFSNFSFEGEDKDLGRRFEDLYNNLIDDQIAREVAAMRDLFDFGLAFFDILEESPLTNSGGGYLDDILGQPTESTRGTSPPVGFGLGGIASWGDTAREYGDNRFGGSQREWYSRNNDGSTNHYIGGSDGYGRATARTRFGADNRLVDTLILERNSDGGRKEIYVNHRTNETEVLIASADGSSLAIAQNPDGEVYVGKTSDGHVEKSVIFQDENGQEVIVVSQHPPPSETDTTGNPGDDPTAGEREFADWLFGQHALGRHNPGGSVKNPNRVNPGDPDDTGNEAPRLNPGISIVINPDLNESNGSGRELSAELGAKVRQQMSEKVGGKINPPGPDERP